MICLSPITWFRRFCCCVHHEVRRCALPFGFHDSQDEGDAHGWSLVGSSSWLIHRPDHFLWIPSPPPTFSSLFSQSYVVIELQLSAARYFMPAKSRKRPICYLCLLNVFWWCDFVHVVSLLCFWATVTLQISFCSNACVKAYYAMHKLHLVAGPLLTSLPPKEIWSVRDPPDAATICLRCEQMLKWCSPPPCC